MDNNPINYGEQIISTFRSIQKGMRDYMEECIKDCGFTIPQLLLINVLNDNPKMKLSELSEKLGLSKSTVSGIVDRLHSQGVVIRNIPENNRRIVEISLTEDFKINNDLLKLKEKYFYDILKDIQEDDIKKIVYALEKLNGAIQAHK